LAPPVGATHAATATMEAIICVQKESMFSVGNDMSRAPSCSGMQKLPKAPMRMGVTAKKIMMVPCIVNSVV
jgi:hypothetical protein